MDTFLSKTNSLSTLKNGPGPKRIVASKNHHFSGATVDGRNPKQPINNGINYRSTGAGFSHQHYVKLWVGSTRNSCELQVKLLLVLVLEKSFQECQVFKNKGHRAVSLWVGTLQNKMYFKKKSFKKNPNSFTPKIFPFSD